MDEMLTIFDKFGKPVGVKGREEVHHNGYWHETFHCWFYEKGQDHTYIYFQKRSADKQDFPNLYDITAAGHIMADEDIVTAGIRELEEELGVSIQEKVLEYAGFYKEELILRKSKDREICHIYLHPFPKEQNYQLGDEVSDLVRIELEDFLSLLSKNRETMLSSSVITGERKLLLTSDLVGHDFYYYQYVIQAILIAVEKL